MCGEKQSVKKVYGKGTGKECRLHVQMLNEKRMLNESADQSVAGCEDRIDEDQSQQPVNSDSQGSSKTSKWGEYLVEENTTVDEVCEEDSKFTFERPRKRKSLQRNVATNGRAKKFKPKMLDTEKFEELTDESTKIHTNTLSNNKISSLIVENSSVSKNISSKWNTFVARDDTDINCTSPSSTTTNTNNIDVPTSLKPKKSKWDNYITETEAENEISSQQTNIFNTSIDCENLDDILDIKI
ncbi:hypothetical protein CBL_06779 [Carabus blaptoides fortunei]